MKQSVLKFLLKLLVSGGLLTWVIHDQIHVDEVRQVWQYIHPGYLALAFVMKFIGLVIGALRWQKLLHFQQIEVKWYKLADSYLIGLFFNTFLPTRIGGDVVRVADLRNASGSVTKSASTVFVERFLGIGVLFLFAFLASLLNLPMSREVPAIWVGLLMGTAGIVMALLIFQTKLISRLLGWMPIPRVRDWIVKTWSGFETEVTRLISHKPALIWGLIYSTVLQLNVVIHYWIIGLALGFQVPLMDYFYIIPIQLMVLMLPAINGIGLREVSSIMLFQAYGINGSQAVMFGLCDFIMLMIMGLMGGIRFIIRKRLPQTVSEGK